MIIFTALVTYFIVILSTITPNFIQPTTQPPCDTLQVLSITSEYLTENQLSLEEALPIWPNDVEIQPKEQEEEYMLMVSNNRKCLYTHQFNRIYISPDFIINSQKETQLSLTRNINFKINSDQINELNIYDSQDRLVWSQHHFTPDNFITIDNQKLISNFSIKLKNGKTIRYNL